jgi:hypothetical protein
MKNISRFILLFILIASGCSGTSSLNSENSPLKTAKTATSDSDLYTKAIETSRAPQKTSPFTTEASSITTVTPSLSLKTGYLPTLTAQEREIAAIDLFLSNADCELPCWWGFKPGETQWDQVANSLDHLGASTFEKELGTGERIYETASFHVKDNSISNRFSFYVESGIVQSIYIASDGIHNVQSFQEIWKNYYLESIFTKYGEPTQILIAIPQGPFEEPADYVNYQLWIIYEKLGFTLIYTGSIKNDPIIQMCPLGEDGPGRPWAIKIFLQMPDSHQSIDTQLTKFGYPSGYMDDLLSFEEATGIEVHDFYTMFLQNKDDTCFSIFIKNNR